MKQWFVISHDDATLAGERVPGLAHLLFDRWLTWKFLPVSALWSSLALSFFFTVTFLLEVGQASLLGGFRYHSRRLTISQVQIAGEIEERGSQFVGEPHL